MENSKKIEATMSSANIKKSLHSSNRDGNNLKDKENKYFIDIDPGTTIEVDYETGEIKSPIIEGTLGVILCAKDPRDSTESAVRVPRLLQSDLLLNFHVAEIAFHAGRFARRFDGVQAVLGSSSHFRFNNPRQSLFSIYSEGKMKTKAVGFLGIYYSQTSNYKLCLVSKDYIWPNELEEYLYQIGYNDKLYSEIIKYIGSYHSESFEDLFYLFHDQYGNASSNGLKASNMKIELEHIGRATLNKTQSKKVNAGWWFNLPVATYPLMDVNLESLLTKFVNSREIQGNIGNRVKREKVDYATLNKENIQITDYIEIQDSIEEKKNKITRLSHIKDHRIYYYNRSLEKWTMDDWFKLCQQLCIGLYRLHSTGRIHGDIRPTNIMAKVRDDYDLEFGSFLWINVGFGFDPQDIGRDIGLPYINSIDDNNIPITPRRLGGGRNSPFFAPELNEAKEYKDADSVSLTKIDDNRSRLQFFRKEFTHQVGKLLPLKEDGKALREIGLLEKGDRIQVQEFLFDVESVEDYYIVVSNIYELFLDRIIIQKVMRERKNVHDRLKTASISDYRIFKQWSQATDIFGFGSLTLYIFYMRGLQRIYAKGQKKQRSQPANWEDALESLVNIFKDSKFLLSFLNSLYKYGFHKIDFLWDDNIFENLDEVDGKQVPLNSSVGVKIKKISDYICTFNTNFKIVRRGLNDNNGLFVLHTLFCLMCLWRKQDFDSLNPRSAFPFEPFCSTRLMIHDTKKSEKAAYATKEMLIKIIMMISKNSDMLIEEET